MSSASRGSTMQSLPLHPSGNPEHGLVLARRRDRLLERAAGNPDAFQKALNVLALECARETLRLTGADVSLPEVREAAIETEKPGPRLEPDRNRASLIQGQLAALRLMERRARSEPSLTVSLIRDVHRYSTPSADGSFRREPIASQFGRGSTGRAELVPLQLENLMEWLRVESGRSMYPPEKAALAFARFLEISPFPGGNFRTAHLLLSFFAFAEGYPPFFLRLEEAGEIRGEIQRAMDFDTLPLVSRLSSALARSLSFCLEAVGGIPESGAAGQPSDDPVG